LRRLAVLFIVVGIMWPRLEPRPAEDATCAQWAEWSGSGPDAAHMHARGCGSDEYDRWQRDEGRCAEIAYAWAEAQMPHNLPAKDIFDFMARYDFNCVPAEDGTYYDIWVR
jgi:hypothetical protein